MIDAIRPTGWVTLNTQWQAIDRPSFVAWVRQLLAPRLRARDIVFLDNLKAHRDPEVRRLIRARGATVHYLPPYSPDLSPIEPSWGAREGRHPTTRPAHRARAAARRPAGAPRRPSGSLLPVVHARGISSTEVSSGISSSRW